MKTKRGFTLIETIIYTALLAFVIGGALSATYNIIEGSGRLDGNAVRQEEGNFVLRKINWALSSASGFSITSSSELFVTRYDGTTVNFKLVGAEVDMKETGGAFLPLTTDNVTVTDLLFQNIPAIGSGPKGVTATLTLKSGVTFSTTKYLRK